MELVRTDVEWVPEGDANFVHYFARPTLVYHRLNVIGCVGTYWPSARRLRLNSGICSTCAGLAGSVSIGTTPQFVHKYYYSMRLSHYVVFECRTELRGPIRHLSGKIC